MHVAYKYREVQSSKCQTYAYNCSHAPVFKFLSSADQYKLLLPAPKEKTREFLTLFSKHTFYYSVNSLISFALRL